jgi:energy-coupling factor transporter ATP-binding protein EcfA2
MSDAVSAAPQARVVTMEPAVQITDLTYRYRGEKTEALKGVSLSLDRGEFLVVMGPSGAGKSTLAAAMNGLIPNFFKGKIAGEVRIFGQKTTETTVARNSETVGIVFQDFEAQLFSTNLELEVTFGMENFGIDRDEMHVRMEEVINYVGIAHLKGRAPSTLSGGQKQKLAIASVLAMKPRVVVMDEPTTDLDPISKMGVFEITRRLCEHHDTTLMMIEHETEEALFADKIALMQDGRLIRLGPTREVLGDVDLMRSVGVAPLGIPSFFKRMGESDLPITVDEGVARFNELGWKVSAPAFQKLTENEAAARAGLGEVLIRCDGLDHTYDTGLKALDNVTCEVRRGDVLAILGQNGSGKTTLAKHFNGLLMPTGGEVLVDGKPTRDQGIFKIGQKIGYVFQNPDHQIFSETVFDEVAFSSRLRKLPEDEIKARVAEALASVGLTGMEKEDPFSLTKSGRQRVAVASVLASKPDVLILDEPTTGLDYSEQRGMMDLVQRLNKAGSTIIFVTHHMWVVAEYARSVIVMKEGRVILQGTPREVFSHGDRLHDAFLRPPHFVDFSNRLGHTFLTPEEMAGCIVRGTVA